MEAALREIAVSTSPEAEEAVFALLEAAAGQTPVVYQDIRRNRTTLTVHLVRRTPSLPIIQALRAGLRRIRQCGLDPAPARIRARILPRLNWAESWKRHFPVLEIGRRLLIRPSWSRRRPRKDQLVIEIDPGLSFGTGHHPTTRFCLEELVRAASSSKPRSLLDAGTGSALLAIAGVKLGYRPVEAFDFDPIAVRVARSNARRNEVSPALRIHQLDLRDPSKELRPRDVVCANLQADLLLAERDRLTHWVIPGGQLILAGVLRTEIRSVVDAYEASGFSCVRTWSGGEWTSATLRRVGT